MGKVIRIIKWAEFQHYKDRSPPWIKLHRSMMTSETWVGASTEGRVLAIACMMLASDTGNSTPANVRYIKRVAYLDFEPDLQELVDLGFIEIIEKQAENDNPDDDASKPLADACPEERRGEERETEEKRAYAFSGSVIRLTETDFSRWETSFPDIDLRACLQSRDDWLRSQDDKARKTWFNSTSSWLRNQQNGIREKRKVRGNGEFAGPC